ncbi:MAG: cation:proton antiporter [Campylobacterales bacterium]|nr:cation:proton antiporter [Campylobacterales bacterium]
MDNILLIIILSLLLIFTPFFAKLTRLPIAVVEILAGAIVGFLGLIHENGLFDVLAEVGFLYLMFLAGLEINLKHLATIPKEIINRGYAYHFLIYLFSVIFVFILGLSHFYMVVLPLIAIGIVMTLTKDYDKDLPWLDLSLKLGVMGEILSIIVLTFAAGIMLHGFSSEFLFIMLSLAATLVLIVILFYVFRVVFWWFPELKTWLMPYSDNKGQDLRLSFAFFFIMISFMMILELELVLGAFTAGMLISSFFEHKKELPEKLSSFGFGLLVPLFFIHIGTTIEYSTLFMDGLWTIVFLFVGLTMTIRFLSSLVFVKSIGFRGTVLFALSQSIPLTLVIAAATVAYQANSIDELNYTALVIGSVLNVIIATVAIKFLQAKEPKKLSGK